MDSFKELTYPRIDLKDYTLDANLPMFPPTQHARNASQTDLGLLKQLPLELLQASLLEPDLRSLIDFRMVNRRGCSTVDNIPQFSSITKHAQIAVHAALVIRTAPWITCKQLYNTLCTAECKACGDLPLFRRGNSGKAGQVPMGDPTARPRNASIRMAQGYQHRPNLPCTFAEEGRTIGFVMEHIVYAHHAEPEEILSCQEALERLHKLGIQHGDVNKHNIWIREEYATLVDFACATQCRAPGLLAAEPDSLGLKLYEPSGRGRPMGQ